MSPLTDNFEKVPNWITWVLTKFVTNTQINPKYIFVLISQSKIRVYFLKSLKMQTFEMAKMAPQPRNEILKSNCAP